MEEALPVTRLHHTNPNLKKYAPGPYIRFYPKRWLEGTLRTQNDDPERAFWVDLLSMAALSTYPGVIAATKEGHQYIGYPVGWIAGHLQRDCSFVIETLNKFEKQNRITIEKQGNDPNDVSVIRLVNFKRYQSEYQRQKPYREAKKAHEEQNPPLPGLETPSTPNKKPSPPKKLSEAEIDGKADKDDWKERKKLEADALEWFTATGEAFAKLQEKYPIEYQQKLGDFKRQYPDKFRK